MIEPYYSRGCESRELFLPFEIAKDPEFDLYRNKLNVLHFDVATYFYSANLHQNFISRMDAALLFIFRYEARGIHSFAEKLCYALVSLVYKYSRLFKFIHRLLHHQILP